MPAKSTQIIRAIILCVVFLHGKAVLAQTEEKVSYGYKISGLLGYHFAPNVVNKTNMSLNGYVKGFEISLVKYGLQKPLFTQVYGRPKLSVNAKFFMLNKPDTFGYSLGLIPTYDLPIISHNKLGLAARFGYGLNLNTVQYHREKNFDNRAISSAINFGFDIGASARYTFTSQLELEANAGLYHVSNGSLKMPNGGLNIMYGSLGLCYFPQGIKSQAHSKPNYADTSKNWQLQTQVAIGYRELGYFNNVTQFWVASASANILYRFNKLFSSGLGIDGFYDATHALQVSSKLRVRDISESQKYQLAMGMYNKFTIGKLFLPLGVYHYVYPIQAIQEPMYIRFGLGYQFHPKTYIGLFFKGTINKQLKLQSDFMELSLGQVF